MPVRVTLRVQPGASSSRVTGRTAEGWKVAVRAPPVDGKANQACVKLLAELAGVAPSAVRLVHGASGRRKLFEVEGVERAELERRLEEAL